VTFCGGSKRDQERCDYGVNEGSPVWGSPEVNPDSIEILHFDILGIDVDPRILPKQLQDAIHALSNEVEFE
jgi:hypothetical protein